MTKRINVGVAGAGVFGGFHASKFASHPAASLAGIFDINQTNARLLAEKLSTEAYSTYASLLAKTDAVVIAAPASAHYALAQEALSARKHVFVEKPIALSLDEADALIALAAQNNVMLQTGHQERYVFEAAGLLGRRRAPLKIDSIRCTSASGRCEDVSVALDLMVHDIDLIRQMTNADIENISAEGGAHEASADIMLTNGTVVFLKASRRATPPERRMSLVYDDGVVEFDFIKREISNSTPAALNAGFSNDDSPLAFTDPLAHGANEFIASISENRPPSVNGHDGREALRWARRIEQAAGIAVGEENKAMERRRA